ncbi:MULTISPECIES: hypothetical protein [unclassified Methylophilus]|uniref:hypothetical protein n=1 Tax=unclassified Methylophilus TaxID=2630143 RepID=UPI00037B2F63|nr:MULTISPECIES: hypothetical protein [unclassified Methylophilus]
MAKPKKKHGVACLGTYQPFPTDFLKSRACAELSPLALKLLIDMLATLGPNSHRNGDISIAPKLMAIRGWSSRSSLNAAMNELLTYGLIEKTRQGSRLDCSLFAITLYPLSCDMKKLDVSSETYKQTDFMGPNVKLAAPPTPDRPAKWRQPRKLNSDDP